MNYYIQICHETEEITTGSYQGPFVHYFCLSTIHGQAIKADKCFRMAMEVFNVQQVTSFHINVLEKFERIHRLIRARLLIKVVLASAVDFFKAMRELVRFCPACFNEEVEHLQQRCKTL